LVKGFDITDSGISYQTFDELLGIATMPVIGGVNEAVFMSSFIA